MRIPLKHSGPVGGTEVVATRWSLFIERWMVGIDRQVRWPNRAWSDGGYYYCAGLQRRPKLGYFSGWYDGQHYAVHLGWCFVNWSR